MLFRWAGVLIAASGSWTLMGQIPSEPDYTRDVRPIIERSCLPCHHDNGTAPFSFEKLEAVKRHSKLISTMALSGVMPPTVHESAYGELSLAPRLTDEELVILQRWFRLGMPGQDQSTPYRPRQPHRGKTIVGEVPSVRAEGAPYGIEFALPASEIGNVAGFDWKARSPLAVRRVLLSWSRDFIAPREVDVMDFGSRDVIGMLAPGYRPYRLPEGTNLQPRGDYLRVLLWVHPTGKPEKAEIELTPIPGEGKPAQLVTIEHPPFIIEPHTNPVLKLRHEVNESTTLVSLLPEARFSVSSITVWHTPPGGDRKKVYSTLRWDPLWTGHYALPKPLALPKGSLIEADFQFNNDERCAMNEAREPEQIRSGPRKGEEVCRLHLVMTR